MTKVVEGKLNASGMKIAMVVARFNDFITEKLQSGAVDALNRCGASPEDLAVFKVPGAFEIPLIAKKVAESGKYDGVICLGAVIRGSTPHFDYVAAEASKGIAQASMESGTVISFGVITTDTIEQAIERAGTKAGNKGWSTAMSCIEMVDLLRQI